MKKTAILLILITVISKVFGFLRDITLSYFYGASAISDAYLVATTISGVVFSLILVGISTSYIPLYKSIENMHGQEESNRYTNNLVNILFVVSSIIIIFGFLFTEQLVNIFASGFNEDVLSLTVKFTRISLFVIYFTGVISVFKGFLQLHGNYLIPALIALPLNLITILFIYISSFGDIMLLAVGTVIATASQLILLIPFVYKKGYNYKPIINYKDKHIKDMALIALPVTIGVSIDQVNVLIDRTIASQITMGGISALNYANRLNWFVQGVLVSSIIAIMYPLISAMVVENNMKGFKKTVLDVIGVVNLLIIPATVGAMVLAEPIVRFLFDRGAFDEKSLALTSSAFFFYSVGMLGLGLREVLSKAFYSLKDTKTPMVNAVIAVILNIVLNIILSKFLGIGGLALATSISSLFCTGLLMISLRKKIGSFGIKKVFTPFVKIVVSSLVMGALLQRVYNLLFESLDANLTLFLSIVVGMGIYVFMIFLLKVEYIEILTNNLKRKIGKINR